MTTDTDESYKAFYAAIALLLIPIGLASHGFAAMKLYEWFVMPLWSALPAIGMAHWIGIAMFVAIWRKRSSEEDEPLRKAAIAGAARVAFLWVAVVIGWIMS